MGANTIELQVYCSQIYLGKKINQIAFPLRVKGTFFMCQEDNSGKCMIGHIRYGQLPACGTAVLHIKTAPAVFKLEKEIYGCFFLKKINVLRIFYFTKLYIDKNGRFISLNNMSFFWGGGGIHVCKLRMSDRQGLLVLMILNGQLYYETTSRL